MSDDLQARLIVMDTGPLITLAAADSLDYLLYPHVPVYIPDAILYEATRDAQALGAAKILEWVQKHSGDVRTLSTEVFFNYVRDQELSPGRRERDIGERAAIEAIHDAIHLEPNERALLVTEDDRVLRRALVVEPELNQRLIPITTRDFLEGLESAHRINSADEIYRRAEDAGRLASRRAALADQHAQARDAVQQVMARSSSERDYNR